MKSFAVAAGLFAGVVGASASKADPLGQVFALLDDLSAKITKEGEVEEKAFHEFVEWCDDTTRNGGFAIKTAEDQKAKLEAKIAELSSEAEVASGRIEDHAASIATAEAELKNATTIREKEAADFAASEAELTDAIDTLERATALLEREMRKNPAAALTQVDGANPAAAIQAMSAILEAAAFPGSDQKKLVALVQQRDQGEDADMGAPAADAYKSHSSSILDVLQDMKEKAEDQLSDLRKAEVNTRHNFEMLKQSLTDQSKADAADLEEQKSAKAAAEESKASAEGDLQRTTESLANSQKGLETARASCISTAADHEATVAARQEELKVIAEARKLLQESTSGAASQTYAFVQLTGSMSMRSSADLARSEIVTLVKRLAKQQHSPELAQLASRIAAVARMGATAGQDPFAKVRSLITDMIAKLEKEAGAEATEKAYCDEQMEKTEAKKAEVEHDVEKVSGKIDQADARSAELKEEIQELEGELAALTREQAEMDKVRFETHAEFVTAKAELEQGLEGVRKALSVLRDYYANKAEFLQQPAPPQKFAAASGAGTSIIGILEVVESDFAKNLAKEETEEDDAQADYEKTSQINKVTRAGKEKDVEYKTKESKSLDKTAAELRSDRDGLSTELAAVNEYYAKLKERCIAKPETYAQRAERRTAEISGLKQALSVLEDETALVQKRKKGGNFRGTLSAY